MNLKEYLYNWESYIHYEEKDRLVQLAIVHAHFEITPPFLDGNARIGRALIPLFLCEKELLRLPVFYMSGYLEKNREEYYNRLQNISQNKDWQGWISSFLKAIINQSPENTYKAKSILSLYHRIGGEIAPKLRFISSINVIDNDLFHTI